MLHTAPAVPSGEFASSLSERVVTRLWHIMDLRQITSQEVAAASGIPLDDLFALHQGAAEITVDQLVRLCWGLKIHPLAALSGIADFDGIVPHELSDRETARLAARLRRMPSLGREMLLTQAEAMEDHA